MVPSSTQVLPSWIFYSDIFLLTIPLLSSPLSRKMVSWIVVLLIGIVVTCMAAAVDGLVPTDVPPGNATACPPLSKDLLAKYAKSQTIIIGVSDWPLYQVFGRSWVHNWNALAVNHFLCGAADSKTAEALISSKVPCFDAAVGGQGIGQDMDVVWWRDPLPYFEAHMNDFDFLVSADVMLTGNPKGDDGPDLSHGPHTNLNTGVYMLKASDGGEALMKGWLSVHDPPKGGQSDQTGLYEYVRIAPGVKTGRAFTVSDGKTRVGILPVTSFMHSYSYLIERAHTVHGVEPYEFHTVWGFGGIEGKRHRMREAMMYYDPPEYYNPSAMMTVDLTYPTMPEDYNTWTENEPMIQFHLKAMDMQLHQVRHAIAVAIALRRVLVLPKLRCFCIKNWFGSERCRVPGDKVTIFPFNCSLGQAMRPKKLYGGVKVGDYTLEFKEHSFTENARTPEAVKNAYTWVLPADDVACKNCVEEGLHHDQRRQLKIGSKLDDEGFVQALARYKGIQVLRFVGVYKMMERFTNASLQKEFEDEMKLLSQKWCCRGPKEMTELGKPREELMPMQA